MNALKLMVILNRVEKKFKELLQAKTNWGRNDVMDCYQEAVKLVIEELANEEA